MVCSQCASAASAGGRRPSAGRARARAARLGEALAAPGRKEERTRWGPAGTQHWDLPCCGGKRNMRELRGATESAANSELSEGCSERGEGDLFINESSLLLSI